MWKKLKKIRLADEKNPGDLGPADSSQIPW